MLGSDGTPHHAGTGQQSPSEPARRELPGDYAWVYPLRLTVVYPGAGCMRKSIGYELGYQRLTKWSLRLEAHAAMKHNLARALLPVLLWIAGVTASPFGRGRKQRNPRRPWWGDPCPPPISLAADAGECTRCDADFQATALPNFSELFATPRCCKPI